MTRVHFVSLFGAAALTGALLAGPAGAMPVEQDYYAAPGVTADGRLEIREILDDATEMELRLTQQILVLQDQIDQLREEIEALKASQ